MTSIKLETEVATISDILDQVQSGSLALADFQRDFDWSERDARAFLATAVMGWPAGALLFIRGETSDVKSRPFVDGPITEPNPPRLVLDGQQRLTAGFHAICDRGPFIHAIELSVALAPDVEELEDGIRTFRRAVWDERHRSSPWVRGKLYIPAYALRNSDTFFAFRDIAITTAPGTESPDKQLQTAWRERLRHVREYALPVVLISPAVRDRIDDASVARIFERVNRTGQRLGAFDLSVARTYGPARLRDLWDEARLSDARIDRWLGPAGMGDDGMPLLRAMALASERPSVRQSAVLALDGSIIASRWSDMVRGTQRALEFLEDRCGVLEPGWLPYRAMLDLLIAIGANSSLDTHHPLLERWFWSRAFALRFEVAANTRTVEDYGALENAIHHGKELGVDPIRRDAVAGATRRRYGAIFKATQCLLATTKPADPFVGHLAPKSPDVVFDSVIQTGTSSDTDAHLHAAAMAFLRRDTAQALRKGELSLVGGAHPQFAGSQLLPHPTMAMSVTEFLRRRTDNISEAVQRKTGQQVGPIAESE